jgi:hypothetical protein
MLLAGGIVTESANRRKRYLYYYYVIPLERKSERKIWKTHFTETAA